MNIPDPKYKLGDVVLTEQYYQFKINYARYIAIEEQGWQYLEDRVWIGELDIIKKL